MTQLYRPEDEPTEPKQCAAPGCGHEGSHHPSWNEGRCTWMTQSGVGIIARVNACFCDGFLKSLADPEPSGNPIHVDSQEDPVGYRADGCHAILWVEQRVPVLSERLGKDFKTAARTKLGCRFATGHEDAFHENYDGTRWMVQTEDR